MRFGDFTRATRSHTLAESTAENETILATARGLLAAAMPMIRRKGVTLIGISLGNLEDRGPVQLELSFGRGHLVVLDATIDEIRERFGSGAITRAVLVGRDPGLTVPLLPD